MIRRTCFAAAVLAAATAWAASPTAPELLRHVPREARAVVAADTAALRAQPLVQQWLLEHQAEWSGLDDEATRFLRDAGLDPAADVDALMFAVLVQVEAEHPLALFGGRFDGASLSAAVASRGAVPVEVGGVTVYRLDPDADAGRVALMRITDDLVMIGDGPALEASLTREPGPVAVVAGEAAAGHLDLTAPFWMVSEVPEHAPPAGEQAGGGQTPGQRAVLAVLGASTAVRRVAAWARVDDELEVHAFATTATEEDAVLLRDTIRGALAAVRLAAQEKEPRLVDVLRGVTVEADGTVVVVAARIPVDLLQELAGGAHAADADVRRARRARPR